MFNSLSGTITGKYPQKLYIDTHGIEWEVNIPDSSLDALPPVGEEAKVYVWLQHTDMLMTLFGFSSVNDRQLFFDLLKVDGIGPKGALKIMTNISTPDLARVLDSGDVGALEKVPGVGKKTAAKMLLQLKGKLSLEENTPSVSRKAAVPFADVVNALSDMGYDKKLAEQCVARIADELKEDSGFVKQNEAGKEDIIFRRAIVEMAK